MMRLTPEPPEAAGIPEETPPLMQIEGAELLANRARNRLRADGFTDDEVDEWALTYITEEGSGDVDSFVEWIARAEDVAGRR
jgi:hypothetical protein